MFFPTLVSSGFQNMFFYMKNRERDDWDCFPEGRIHFSSVNFFTSQVLGFFLMCHNISSRSQSLPTVISDTLGKLETGLCPQASRSVGVISLCASCYFTVSFPQSGFQSIRELTNTTSERR